MPTLLRNANGTLATRGGILQAIPDGGTAADCLCCGPPPCAFCPDAGGPYSSATLSVTVAGFPATFVYITTGFDGLGQPLRIRRTIEGLDAANGTYALTWNPETCQFVSPFGKTLPLTITTEAWRQGPGDPPDVCSFTQAAPGSSTIEDSFLNVTPWLYGIRRLADAWTTRRYNCRPRRVLRSGVTCKRMRKRRRFCYLHNCRVFNFLKFHVHGNRYVCGNHLVRRICQTCGHIHAGDYWVWNRCANCDGEFLIDIPRPHLTNTPPATVDDRGERKAAICRANRCGRYDAGTDTCSVLTDRGRRGAVAWLLDHPAAACVHSEPCFGVEL